MRHIEGAKFYKRILKNRENRNSKRKNKESGFIKRNLANQNAEKQKRAISRTLAGNLSAKAISGCLYAAKMLSPFLRVSLHLSFVQLPVSSRFSLSSQFALHLSPILKLAKFMARKSSSSNFRFICSKTHNQAICESASLHVINK